MPCPFPGMYPWLEAPAEWPGFHDIKTVLGYSQPPDPPLSDDDAAWARQILIEKGLL